MHEFKNFPKHSTAYPRTLRDAFGPSAVWTTPPRKTGRVFTLPQPSPFATGLIVGAVFVLVLLASLAAGGR